jgi:Domain of unknown function (DUF4304)
MDSSVVNRQIRAEIWPMLRDNGFAQFTSRSAWRHQTDRIDVVNFQSFNSYNADVLDVTTFSFSVNLGSYLSYIPDHHPGTVKLKKNLPIPAEYQCHMRRRIRRSYVDRECTVDDIWFIDKRGSNVEKAIHDVRMVLLRDGIPWFSRFASPSAVYDLLSHQEEDMAELWGFGRPGSPIRCYFLGYAAKAAGLVAGVRPNLMRAAESGSFLQVVDRLRSDAESAC